MRTQTHATVRFDTETYRNLKAFSAASEVPIARVVNAAIKRHLAVVIATLTDEQRVAFVAAGGVLPT